MTPKWIPTHGRNSPKVIFRQKEPKRGLQRARSPEDDSPPVRKSENVPKPSKIIKKWSKSGQKVSKKRYPEKITKKGPQNKVTKVPYLALIRGSPKGPFSGTDLTQKQPKKDQKQPKKDQNRPKMTQNRPKIVKIRKSPKKWQIHGYLGYKISKNLKSDQKEPKTTQNDPKIDQSTRIHQKGAPK